MGADEENPRAIYEALREDATLATRQRQLHDEVMTGGFDPRI